MLTNLSPSLNSSDANTQTEVVPSPTSSSCTLEMLTRILAAALSSEMDFRMVAPSFVTVISPVEADSGDGQKQRERQHEKDSRGIHVPRRLLYGRRILFIPWRSRRREGGSAQAQKEGTTTFVPYTS